jgi:hypothetical protein
MRASRWYASCSLYNEYVEGDGDKISLDSCDKVTWYGDIICSLKILVRNTVISPVDVLHSVMDRHSHGKQAGTLDSIPRQYNISWILTCKKLGEQGLEGVGASWWRGRVWGYQWQGSSKGRITGMGHQRGRMLALLSTNWCQWWATPWAITLLQLVVL